MPIAQQGSDCPASCCNLCKLSGSKNQGQYNQVETEVEFSLTVIMPGITQNFLFGVHALLTPIASIESATLVP